VRGLALYLPFGLAAVAVGVSAIVTNSHRIKALDNLADTRRWDRQARDSDLPKTFQGQPFGEGRGRLATNVMRGRHNDRWVVAFDYRYKTPGGDGDETHHFWVACVEDLPAALPALEVVRRRILPGRASKRTGAEFRLGDPAFDDRFRVVTSSPQLAADVLSPEVVRLLTSWPDFPWRIEGTRLLTWGAGSVKPHWVEPTLNMLCTLAGAIPEHVWRNVRGPGGF
jgi:hypothetical protein